MSDRIPLSRIADTIDARARAVQRYPANMKPETVERITVDLHAGAKALRVIETYADGLRHLIEFLRERQTDARRRLIANPGDMEAAALLAHPAVKPVLDAFPEALLTHVETISPASYLNPDGASSNLTNTDEDDR